MVSLYISLIVTVAEDDKSVLVLIIPTAHPSHWWALHNTDVWLAPELRLESGVGGAPLSLWHLSISSYSLQLSVKVHLYVSKYF